MSLATLTLHRSLIRAARGMLAAWEAWLDAKAAEAERHRLGIHAQRKEDGTPS